MVTRTVFFAALVLAQAARADGTAMPQPVERASADDCAIFVEIGEAELQWGATAPRYDFFPQFDRKGGGTYLEECPWSTLGVAAPTIGGPQSHAGFFISRPVYSGTGVSAKLHIALRGTQHPDGSEGPPYLHSGKTGWAVAPGRMPHHGRQLGFYAVS
jgi:hypothetical protein